MKFTAIAFTVSLALLAASSVTAFAPLPVCQTPPPTTTQLSVARNPNFAKLAGGYLFPEIGRRRNAYLEQNPEMGDRIISLGIGDTTQPIPEHILSGLVNGSKGLGTAEGYSGYGDVQGRTDLRQKIADKLYDGKVEADEVFVSGT